MISFGDWGLGRIPNPHDLMIVTDILKEIVIYLNIELNKCQLKN